MEEAFEMGLKRAEFFRMTPLEFDQRRVAYRRKQETMLLPFRRLEAALWNVQIAKTKDGKQIGVSDLYELELDTMVIPARRKPRKQKLKTHFNADESRLLHEFFNS